MINRAFQLQEGTAVYGRPVETGRTGSKINVRQRKRRTGMTKAVRIGWLPLAVIAAALIALGGWLAVAPSTQAQATSVVVAASDANVAVGGTGDSNITVTPTGVTVGALDLTVTYDSTLASATCATTFGVCNAALTPGTVTFSLAQVSGISGTAGTITFTGVAAGNSPIAVTINTCADDQGADITTCTATNGTLTVSVETATPTPSPPGA